VLTPEGDRIKEATAFVVRLADTPDGYARWLDRAADLGAWRPPSGASACRTASIDEDHVDLT
jgi:hypothetical protein